MQNSIKNKKYERTNGRSQHITDETHKQRTSGTAKYTKTERQNDRNTHRTTERQKERNTHTQNEK